jgi:copper(I)-binding protein
MHGKGATNGKGAAAEVMVQNPYARAVAPGQKNSAVFMTLMNHGKAEHAIVRASGDVSDVVELHTHINDGGVMRMRPIDKITVAAGGKTDLQPGGLHVMLIGLKGALNEGDMVHLTLTFEDGSTAMVMAPVKAVAPAGGGSMNMEGHKHNM